MGFNDSVLTPEDFSENYSSLLTILVDYAVRANFEFLEKLGVERWCFHDRDIAPDGKTIEVCKSAAIYKSVLGKTILEQKN